MLVQKNATFPTKKKFVVCKGTIGMAKILLHEDKTFEQTPAKHIPRISCQEIVVCRTHFKFVNECNKGT